MDGMLNISAAANLGLHAGMLLARAGGQPLSARAMAGRMGVSYHHLAKVLQRLERARLVRAVRGPRGGFLLAREASRIRLMDLYEAVDGPLPSSACLFGRRLCPEGACFMGDVLEELNRKVRERLRETRLSAFRSRPAQR